MTMTVDFWQLVTISLTCLGLLLTAGIAGGRLLWSQIDRRFAERLTALDRAIADIRLEADGCRKLERDLMQLKADLPREYIRREDYIRGQTVLESKMDCIRSEMRSEMSELRREIKQLRVE